MGEESARTDREQDELEHPEHPAQLVDRADALLASGDAAAAVRAMEEALERDPTLREGHNWLGWYHLARGGDPDRALAYLDRAVSVGGWWGPAHQNRGLALEAKGDFAAAYESYESALRCGDAHDLPLVYARLAAFQREWGRYRRALGLFRRALHHERARSGARVAEIEAAAAALERGLRARRAYFPHASEEQPWIEAERPREIVDERAGAPTFKAFREAAAAALAALGQDPRGEAAARVVRRMLDVARVRDLPADFAGERFAVDPAPLAPETRARVAQVLSGWPGLHRLLYARLLAREEPERTGGVQDRIGALIVDERHDDALAALAALRAQGDHEGLLACADLAEGAGEDARQDARFGLAAAYLEHALEAYRYHASGATSGGEGLARMVDVRRVEERLGWARVGR